MAIVTNGGDFSYVVCKFGVSLTLSQGSGGRRYWTPDLAVETQLEKSQLKAGDHLLIRISLPADLPNHSFAEGNRREEHGEIICAFPLVFHIEFVGSSGQLIARDVPVGEMQYDSKFKARGISIPSRPIDLLRSSA